MGKNRSKKRRGAHQQAAPSSIAASLAGKRKLVDLEDDDGEISSEALETTIETLTALASHEGPLLDNLASKAYKELRRALHPFQEAWRDRFDPIDYPARVTALLEIKQWSAALFALDGCAYYHESKLKRGTIQRWVRFCDACQVTGVKLKLIAAILKCTATVADGDSQVSNKHDPRRALELEASGRDAEITNRVTWNAPPRKELTVIDDSDWVVPKDIKVVYHVAAADRKPPNRHDLNMSSTACTSMLSKEHDILAIEKHAVTLIPGAILLMNVLQPHECKRLITTAEKMGYSPDHPVENEDPTGIDTCEWLAAPESEVIYQRILSHLPATIEEEAVTGINARWRLFRYGPNSVYRPHIDGSWPASKFEDGKYVSDDSHRSRLTFLMYLNDGFEGGGTTFYLPKKEGLEAVSVTPQAGNVLMFPQGNTASLVHEGSKVESMDRCKYVIRTDVLYHKK